MSKLPFVCRFVAFVEQAVAVVFLASVGCGVIACGYFFGLYLIK